jgi:hypothetical protein
VAGAFVWLKADAGFTPSLWSDQSGSGNHGRQTTAANQPTAGPAADVNFNPSVQFGNNKWMQINNGIFRAGQTYTAGSIYAVVEPGVVPGEVWVYNESTNDFCRNPVFDLRSNNQALYQWERSVGLGACQALTAQWLAKNAAPQVGVAKLLSASTNVAPATNKRLLYIDGIQGDQSDIGTSFTETAPDCPAWVGANRSAWDCAGTPDNFSNGRIAEIIIFDDNTSRAGTNRSKIESYLAIKYGITEQSGQLPKFRRYLRLECRRRRLPARDCRHRARLCFRAQPEAVAKRGTQLAGGHGARHLRHRQRQQHGRLWRRPTLHGLGQQRRQHRGEHGHFGSPRWETHGPHLAAARDGHGGQCPGAYPHQRFLPGLRRAGAAGAQHQRDL